MTSEPACRRPLTRVPFGPATRLVTRLSALLLIAGSAVVAGAALSPAQADVPAGWSNPDPVNVVHATLLLVGVPLLLFIGIALLVYLPSLVRGERIAPEGTPVDEVWIGGPRTGAGELAAAPSAAADSETGGARGRW